MEESEDFAKTAILQWLNEQYTKNPDNTFLAQEFYIKLENEMKKHGYDTAEKTIGLVKIMAEAGQLHENNRAYGITNKGRKDLETIYNDEWIVEQMNDHKRMNEKKEEEKTKQFKLEERRHQEVIKAAREGNTVQRIGILIALILGASGLIVAIIKP